jgi:hypothetical protein
MVINKLRITVNSFYEQRLILVAFIATFIFSVLFPVARASNIGYVDPNMYIGYSLAQEWLMESSGYEYHATRFPFIYVLKLSSIFGPDLFAIAFRAVLMLLIFLAACGLIKLVELDTKSKLVLILFISMSPIATAASSMTLANGFAAILTLLAISVLFVKSDISYWRIYLSGSIATVAVLTNAWIGSLGFLGIAFWILTEKNKKFGKLLNLSMSILVSAVTLELLWKLKYGLENSIWSPHIDLLSGGQTSGGFGEWKSLLELWKTGIFPWTFISLTAIGVVFPSLVIIYKRQNLAAKRLALLILFLTIASLLSHFMGFNPQFASAWYFFGNFTSYALAVILLYRITEGSSTNLISFVFAMFLVFVLLQPQGAPLQISTILQGVPLQILTMLAIAPIFFNSPSQKGKLTKKTSEIFTFIIACTFSIVFFASALNSFFGNSYNYSGNTRSMELYKDQLFYMKELQTYTSQRHKVAVWNSAEDTTGYLGALTSTSAFHLIRLEGKAAATKVPDPQMWLKRYNIFPEYILIITSKKNTSFLTESKNLEMNGYKEIRSKSFPSSLKLVTMKRVSNTLELHS